MEFINALNNLQNALLNNFISNPKRKQYTLKDVSAHCQENDCWMVVRDLVYDVTSFINEHPGGYDIMLEYAGTDATMAFADKPHSKNAWWLLQKYLIGELIPEERMYTDMP
ncbi:unnamed protein product [Didymodactylos carnosus]|uniref:Cytochrome b5 heme-binding domain-containing protein n=1 Tax=Didymodactylos carnosus TaxID=1234261 RepID=A0A815X9D6_9BILA|nr:unnamed protein product [Didymodactylos carnosus]CAF1554638.1 unnamed protein product [Didymodactylos carnosus]CAF4091635.1 unnamed protein product [Didymodactylos carnosus]CAF4415798.1 unnamed protein product [Didymodactylos carnosus]